MTTQIRVNVQALLDARGMSLRQLAKDIDHDFEGVRRFANNTSTRYSRDLLEKLCDYFECGLTDILIMERIEDAE